METVIADSLVWSRPRRPAHCVVAKNGDHYYVKPVAAKRGIAANVLGARIAAHCGARIAAPALVIFDAEFVKRGLGANRSDEECATISEGVHFGSRYVADPNVTAIYDILPASHLAKVRNAGEFAMMRAIDQWIGNPCSGHAVFARQPERDFIATMIGFGHSFEFADMSSATRTGFAWERRFVESPMAWEITMATVKKICLIRRQELALMADDIPPDWWRGHPLPLTDIIECVLLRQTKLTHVLSELRQLEETRPPRKLVHTETNDLAPMTKDIFYN